MKLSTTEKITIAGASLLSLFALYKTFSSNSKTMTGSEFVRNYANKGYTAWEAAAFELAKQGGLTPRAWVPITLTDGTNTAIIQVQSDGLAIGPENDSIRLPMTPIGAQNIFNLYGWLFPTPWLSFQIYKNAAIKLTPTSIAELGESNKGANLAQIYKYSQFVDRQKAGVIAAAQNRIEGPELVAGQGKHIVVSNIYQPGKVLIFGWYRPPPSPMVFDDGRPMATPGRQPIQPKSNVHGDFYFDYSHIEQAVHPISIVNRQQMNTIDLYQHPIFSKLVSNEGPIKFPRYPSNVPVVQSRPAHMSTFSVIPDVVPTIPGIADSLLNRRG